MASDCSLFNFIVWGVVGTCICCFGFVGNLLSLVTFQRERRSPATTLLQCLASSDFVLLLSVFVTDALPYICDHTGTCANPWKTWPYIRYIWILTPISHMCSIWFVVLIAVNRYWAVCQPHSLSTVWTNQRTPIYVTSALVLVISFNLPRFFEYEIVYKTNPDTNITYLGEQTTDFGDSHSYKVVYKVMLVNTLLVMLPIAALIVLTGLILYGLRMQTRRRTSQRRSVSKEMRASIKSKSGGRRGTTEITFVLVVVVMVAIACQSSLAAFHFVRHSNAYACGNYVYYLDSISKLLVNVNSCVNFIIYCIASPKFRTVLQQLITCQGSPVGSTGRGSIVASSMKRNGTFTNRDTDVWLHNIWYFVTSLLKTVHKFSVTCSRRLLILNDIRSCVVSHCSGTTSWNVRH